MQQRKVWPGLDLIVPQAARLVLADDEEYIDDLVGCVVSDQGTPIGSVYSVDFPTASDGIRRLEDAAPLLTVLTPDGDEILIPYVQAFLITVSTSKKRIDMHLPAGLLNLNL